MARNIARIFSGLRVIAIMKLNDIAEKQNQETQFKLLRAQREMYNRAKRILTWQMILTVALPVTGAIATMIFPGLKPFVALGALIIAIVDVALLDRLKKRHISSAARIQEDFDCSVLNMSWNSFVVGKRVLPETIHEAAEDYSRRHTDDTLVDWYPPVVGKVDLHLARIVCQRTNLWYDSKVRRRYGSALITVAAILAILFTIIGMSGDMTLTNFVLSVMAPLTPFVSWAAREYYRQKDVADMLDRVRTEAEALWEKAKAKQCEPSDCTAQSRSFQDAIFTHRATSTPIFNWVYERMRSRHEDQMNVGATELVNSIDR
jgi:hypothetical protein